jgi:hypothetical protein
MEQDEQVDAGEWVWPVVPDAPEIRRDPVLAVVEEAWRTGMLDAPPLESA